MRFAVGWTDSHLQPFAKLLRRAAGPDLLLSACLPYCLQNKTASLELVSNEAAEKNRQVSAGFGKFRQVTDDVSAIPCLALPRPRLPTSSLHATNECSYLVFSLFALGFFLPPEAGLLPEKPGDILPSSHVSLVHWELYGAVR